MREVNFTAAFRRDFKRLARSGQADMTLLEKIVAHLANDLPLDDRYRDHALTGDWAGYRECHVKPDWLLIYKLAPNQLFLTRSGSHAELFG
jgi:mRNA interferase YafQ